MILSGATVVTSLDPVEVVTTDVHVVDGRIAASFGGASRDCSGCLVVPGNVCAHTHLYSALARGMPYTLEPPSNFTQILQRSGGASTGRSTRARSARPRSSAAWRRCSRARRPSSTITPRRP